MSATTKNAISLPLETAPAAPSFTSTGITFYGSNWAARNFKEVWEWCQSSNEASRYPLTTDLLAETSEPQPTETSYLQPIETSDTRPTTPITPITPITPTAIITLDLSGLSSDPPTKPLPLPLPPRSFHTFKPSSQSPPFTTSPPLPTSPVSFNSPFHLLLPLPSTSLLTLLVFKPSPACYGTHGTKILTWRPRCCFCGGLLIETLITSGVSRHLEFKGVEKSFIFDGEEETFDKGPNFQRGYLYQQIHSLVDKRKLMKFLTFALEYENSQEAYEGYEAKPFAEFLKDKYRIDGKLLRAVLYSIALNGVADEANTMDVLPEPLDSSNPSVALATTHSSIRSTMVVARSLRRSVGRLTLCVSGYTLQTTIPCRSSKTCSFTFSQQPAVASVPFGGIYMLNHRIPELLVSKETGEFVGLVDTNGQTLKSKWLITAPDYVPKRVGRGQGGSLALDLPRYRHYRQLGVWLRRWRRGHADRSPASDCGWKQVPSYDALAESQVVGVSIGAILT
ncbi:hypothetical protein BC937DRAFT_88504 [Endogone sp. FLAS-F59071]|nr:hypothetical protein BC937DRAFT_88504 [Endogone sp. FLAS-F59071]|eukprot:RUS18636.1 hypothetical protein BC937DRAFT_88504 [Endogone sp. FLAS-F59071]